MSVEWKLINKILWCIQAEGGVKTGTDFHRISRKYSFISINQLFVEPIAFKTKNSKFKKETIAPYPSSNWIYEKHNNHYTEFFNLNGN